MKELPDINSLPLQLSTKLVVATSDEQIDEYGFIVMSKEEKKERTRWFQQIRYLKGGSTIGCACHCRGLCIYLPHKAKGTRLSFRKTGEYWCKECERAIRCPRCRCCGNLGRAEPRHRNRDYHKRIE